MNKRPIVYSSIYVLLCCLVFSPLSLVFAIHSVHASSPKSEYDNIQKKIEKKKKELKAVKKRGSSVFSDLDNVNKQLRITESELNKFRKRIRNTEAKIARVEAEISSNKGEMKKYRNWIKNKLRALYRYGHSPDIVLLFLNSDDISQITRNAKYLQIIADYEHGLMNNFRENVDALNKKEQRLKGLKAELVQTRENLRKEEISLERKQKSKKKLLASIKREETSYYKMLKELEEASKKLLEIIRESERQKADMYAAKGFSKLKGALPWPLNGKIGIPYGTQKDPQFNTPIFRSGAFIQSSTDTLAKAVHNGKVVFAEWFKGYGQLVIVNHGEGYHTLYGSLSEIFPRVGDIIKRKQVIGRVGSSGILNAPGVYFELRYKGKPLDPSQWLKRK